VNDCDCIRFDRLDIRSLLQLSNALPSFSHTARSGVGISQVSQCSGARGLVSGLRTRQWLLHTSLSPVDPPGDVAACFRLELNPCLLRPERLVDWRAVVRRRMLACQPRVPGRAPRPASYAPNPLQIAPCFRDKSRTCRGPPRSLDRARAPA
jgi:hypothetical protein